MTLHINFTPHTPTILHKNTYEHAHFIFLHDISMAMAQPVATWLPDFHGKIIIQSHSNLRNIFDRQSSNRRCYSCRTSYLHCRYHSTNITHSFIHLILMVLMDNTAKLTLKIVLYSGTCILNPIYKLNQ